MASAALPMQDSLEPEDRIVGGVDTTIDKIPYQVSFRYEEEHICGGSIISSRHVITAAHCIAKPSSPSIYSVLAGSTNRTGDEQQQLREVARLVKHPDFSIKQILNDIGVVFVVADFYFNNLVQPIKLPQPGVVPEKGNNVAVSGWGVVENDDGYLPDVLQSVSIQIVGTASCNESYKGFIKEGMVCAGARLGRKGACKGDSGGPLSLDGTLVGVVSFGRSRKCGDIFFPGVYTRVSHYVDWISKTISFQ